MKADVVVNPTNKGLQLDRSVISRLILQKGGPIIQRECLVKYPNGIKIENDNLQNGLAVTSAGNLKNFRSIFHYTMRSFSKDSCLDKSV